MADAQRLDELRRRVQKDPASLAFAQLGEEYRRAGRLEEAIRTCRDGLSHHPAYLSARVTLGRALLALGDIDPAEDELQAVLQAAPENLAALRGLAEIHQLRGRTTDALAHFRAAHALAPDDPDLTRAIAALEGTIPAAPGPESSVTAGGELTAAQPASHTGPQQPASGPQPPEPAGALGIPPPASAADPVAVVALERWLAAIRADRAARHDNQR